MDADGIDVFHTADCYCVVVGIAHNLKLYFLVALDALFNENLVNGGKSERIYADFNKFFFIVGESAARSAQCEGGAQNYGVADSFRRLFCLVK